MEINITERLNAIDNQAFNNDENFYDLSYLYESQNVSKENKKRIVEELAKENVNAKAIYDILTETFEDMESDESLNDGVFKATAYYATNFSGVEDDIETTDYSELEAFVWDKLQKGFFVIADGLDGLNHRYSPDKVAWGDEAFGIEDYLVESLTDKDIKEKFGKSVFDMSTKEIIDNGLEDDYVKLVDEQADLELDEAADADKLKQLQDAQKKFADRTNKAEKSIDKSLNKIDKKSNLIKRIFGKKDESLTEGFNRNDVGYLADEMCRLLDDNHIRNELYDYKVLNDNHCKVDIWVSGDWKHDHLASDWILRDWGVKNNLIVGNHGTDVDYDTGEDWFEGVHHYVISQLEVEELPEDERQGVMVIRESYADDLADDDLDNPKAYKKKFTNGTLAEFDPQSLMDKVAETGYAINTIRENGGDTYFISIHYKEWFGPKGIDNPEEVYYVDIIKETADGKQTREVLQDGTADEIVNILNDWKASVV